MVLGARVAALAWMYFLLDGFCESVELAAFFLLLAGCPGRTPDDKIQNLRADKFSKT